MNKYETIFILKPDLSEEGIEAVYGRIREALETRGGIIIKIDNWGRKKLAYEIKKHTKGIYLYLLYVSNAAGVAEAERLLRVLQDQVLKYMTVNMETGVDPQSVVVESADYVRRASRDPQKRRRDERDHESSFMDDDYEGRRRPRRDEVEEEEEAGEDKEIEEGTKEEEKEE